ncbi:cytochrome P450 [Dactylonectria macrodidyma]|uniref:Cytochrome P450 n=1 Tax=Dactylonectria macrodidyma TaxID=307937 RepID=A0A9P9DSR6_9HYPO|nr:cytochrome P450 [Dactylonectria macrodidyma]
MSTSQFPLFSASTENLGSRIRVKDLPALGLALLVLWRVGLIIYRVWFHPLSKFPGPRYLAATNLPYLYRNHIKGLWVRDVASLHRKYGPVIRIAPNRLALDGSVGWPEVYAHRVAGKEEFSKVPGFFFNGDWRAILGAPRDIHRRQRRQLGHAFSEAAMYEQESIIKQYIDLLIEQLTKRAKSNESVDIIKWLNFTTFDIIGDLTFADSFHSLSSSDYHPWVLDIFDGIRGNARRRFLDAYPLLRPLIWLTTGTEEIKKATTQREFAMDKAKARMALGTEPGRRDFMTYMMKANREGEKGMTDMEILLNAPILIIAGSETTATALSGFFFYICRTPKAYKTLAEEIRFAFKDESEINMRSTSSLQYLHSCIEEALRVYPPAAETPPRMSPGDMITGKFVPAGTLVSVYQWATFRNPDNFKDPDSYRPERWLPSTHPLHDPQFDDDNRSVFKPFSYGTRDCIGKNLSYSEMRVIAARMFYRFDFELDGAYDDWHETQPSFLVWEKTPLVLRLKLCDTAAGTGNQGMLTVGGNHGKVY